MAVRPAQALRFEPRLAFPPKMSWADLEDHAAPYGLILMGTLHDDGDTLALLGAGPGMWPRFRASRECTDGNPDPLDRWSKRVIGGLCTRHGAAAVFPSDGPPYAPFIAWARASGRFWQSPTGMLVHDRAGLMISIRGAMRWPGRRPLASGATPNPCIACAHRPCVDACPVNALRAQAPYDVPACKSHLRAPEGVDCMSGGCLVRRACPVSQEFGRDPEQSAFHMRAFVAS